MSMKPNTTVEIPNLTLIKSTDKAGLYRDEDGDQFWLPWSQIRDGSVDKDGDSGSVFIPLWLAEEKGLGYEYDEEEE